RGEHDHARGNRSPLTAVAVLEADRPAAAGPLWGLEPLDLMERVDLGAVLLRARDVGDVDGVLRVDGAAQHAPTEVLAARLPDAAERVVALRAEVHRARQR